VWQISNADYETAGANRESSGMTRGNRGAGHMGAKKLESRSGPMENDPMEKARK